jgi:hypothetical protein
MYLSKIQNKEMKGKVVLVPKQHTMKTYGGVEVKLHAPAVLFPVPTGWV